MIKMSEPKKEKFINILSSLTPVEINQMISERGKKKKCIMPIYFEDDK